VFFGICNTDVGIGILKYRDIGIGIIDPGLMETPASIDRFASKNTAKAKFESHCQIITFYAKYKNK